MKNPALKGFSLIELLAVLVIVGSLSVFVIPRLTIFSHSSQALAPLSQAINIARSVALYSIEEQESLVLFLKDNKISIRKNDIDIATLGINYPSTTGDVILISPSSLLLNFNSFGETQTNELVFVANNKEISATLYSTGLIEE